MAFLIVILELWLVANDGLEGEQRIVGGGTWPKTCLLNKPIEAAAFLLPNAAKNNKLSQDG